MVMLKKGEQWGFFYGKVERSLQLIFLLIVVMLKKEERDFFTSRAKFAGESQFGGWRTTREKQAIRLGFFLLVQQALWRSLVRFRA